MKTPSVVSLCALAAVMSGCAVRESAPALPGAQLHSMSAPYHRFPAHIPPAGPSWITPGAGSKSLFYVVNYYPTVDVGIYSQRNRKLVGNITTGINLPLGVWVDTHRNLWVANATTNDESLIERFPPGKTAPDLELADPNYNAWSLWVARNGAVYVVNLSYYADTEIVEFPPHKTMPKVLRPPRSYPFITAVVGDTKGDLFTSELNASGVGEIDERAAGSKRWRDTGIRLAEPSGLGFDASGNLVASDIGDDVIETFPPGKTTPSNTIQCDAQCAAFAFNERGDRLFVDEYNDGSDTIEEITYPSGTLVGTISGLQTNSIDGVAASPDLYP
ncbi:MAG TPA: hypothetical protein VGI19_17935 [Candidatus Cybelea sp.]